jgi:hypothetical protein
MAENIILVCSQTNAFYEIIYQLFQYRSIVIVRMPCNNANTNITIAILDQSNEDGDENSI